MKNLIYIFLILIAISGFLCVLFATTWGVGLSPDSVTYLIGGKNILSGHGFTTLKPDGTYAPLTHFAPFYSITLSLGGIIGVNPVIVARWIGAISFGILIFSIGFVLVGFFEGDPNVPRWYPVLAALFALISVTFIEIYVMAWSETIFLVFALWSLILLGKYLDQGRFLGFVISGLLTGLAIFTRYAGAAILGTALLGIIIFGGMRFGKRLLLCLLYGVISVIPILFWELINLNNTQTGTIREIAFHPITIGQIRQALTTFASWMLIPENSSGLFKAAALLVIAFLFVYFLFVRRLRQRDNTQKGLVKPIPGSIVLMVLFQAVYLPFLAISISFLDANTPLDSRILSPIYLFGIILIFYITGQLLSMNRKLSLVTIAVGVIGLIIFAGYLVNGIGFIQKSHNEGIGFNSAIWQRSSTLATLEKLSLPGVIYSNVPEAIYVQTGETAFSLPKKFDSVLQRPNPEYSRELSEVFNQLKSANGVLVYFNEINRSNVATENEIMKTFPIQVIKQTGDGTIYRIPDDQQN